MEQVRMKNRVASHFLFCFVLLTVAAGHPFVRAEEEAQHAKALSEKAQNDFLAKRTNASMIGSFNGYASLLYATREIAIHTESSEIASTPMRSFMPKFYEPTWRELFDAIALQTQSEWHYDAKNDYWVFGNPQKPKTHYTLEIAQDWTPDDQGNCVCYRPAIAPVGMDIYIMGSYSSDNPEGANELYQKIKDSFAVMFAKTFKDDVTPADMKEVTVNTYRALHFEITSEKGIIWRQWVIVEAGKAFVIVSAIKPKHDAQLYPDVQKMIGSFTISK